MNKRIVFLLFLTGIFVSFTTIQGQITSRFGINTKAWYMGNKAGIKFTANGPVPVYKNIAGYGSQFFQRINLIYDHQLDTVQCYSSEFCFYNQITSQIFPSYPSSIWTTPCDSIYGLASGFSAIIPSSSDSTVFYLFSASSYNNNNCYMNWAGIQFNGQYFELISEDSMFVPNYLGGDFGLVRHGNGRDYWLLFHRHPVAAVATNEYMSVLFSDGVITDTLIQHIGNFADTPLSIQFNHRGDKVAVLNYYPNQTTVSELYDFDRCTGLLSNLDTIRVHQTPESNFLCGVFSPNDSLLYINSLDTLFQYQVYSSNISSSAIPIYTTIMHNNNEDRRAREMAIGPDKKLYVGITASSNAVHTDSVVGYLDVIHYPDIVGTQCSYQPYAVYLGGNQSEGGLPYIYEYDKGPLLNSPCDTLSSTTGISSASSNTSKISLAPNPAQTQATLTWSGLREGTFALRDMLGRAVMSEQLNTPSGTTQLDLSQLPKGIYLWQVQSVGFTKNGKLIVE
jgi:hypothetical protein